MRRGHVLAALLILGVIGCARARKSSPDGEEILRMGNGTIRIGLAADPRFAPMPAAG